MVLIVMLVIFAISMLILIKDSVKKKKTHPFVDVRIFGGINKSLTYRNPEGFKKGEYVLIDMNNRLYPGLICTLYTSKPDFLSESITIKSIIGKLSIKDRDRVEYWNDYLEKSFEGKHSEVPSFVKAKIKELEALIEERERQELENNKKQLNAIVDYLSGKIKYKKDLMALFKSLNDLTTEIKEKWFSIWYLLLESEKEPIKKNIDKPYGVTWELHDIANRVDANTRKINQIIDEGMDEDFRKRVEKIEGRILELVHKEIERNGISDMMAEESVKQNANKVTYFDVEWANNTNKSICQMGLICEDLQSGGSFYPECSILINPEDGFDAVCVSVHGITKGAVQNAKTFPEVWAEVQKYFTNSIVIGHNVCNADLNALEKSLLRYNLDIPELYYVDTLELAKAIIPHCYIDGYGMGELCRYYGIDIENAHDAFDDACACKGLLMNLMHTRCIDIESYVHKYIPHGYDSFINYYSVPQVRKAITAYYGIVSGITADKKIDEAEIEFLKNWKKENDSLLVVPELRKLVDYIDSALGDGILSTEELNEIHSIVVEYHASIKAAPETVATQILDGYLKGMSADRTISTEETKKLEQWLYDYSFLAGHFPYDRIYSMVQEVLADGVVTEEESTRMIAEIATIINPVETLAGKVDSLAGKVVCLSGNFRYGQKRDVAEYIKKKGCLEVVDSLTKKVDILVVGSLECEAFSNGSYGTKVKKAIEYNNKGCNIIVMKEDDLFQV